MLRTGELQHIFQLIRAITYAKTMVEIGCHEGKTAIAILREFPALKKYIGIDIAYGHQPKLKAQSGETPKHPGCRAISDPRFDLIVRPHGSFDMKTSDIGSAEVVFIDGDHSTEAVRHDTDLARAIVAKGIIIWHDYTNPDAEVTSFIDHEIRVGHCISRIANTWLACEQI